jgi:hypothetical protein
MYYVVEVWLGSTKTVTPIPFKEGEIMRMFVIMSVMVLFGLGISPLSSQQEGEGFVISRQMLLWDVWSETPEIQGEYGVNNWEHFRNETSRVNSMEEGDLPWRKVITGQFVILPPRAVRAMAAGRAQEQQEVASTISDELATLQARIAELEQELAQATAQTAVFPGLSNREVLLLILGSLLLAMSAGLVRGKRKLRKELASTQRKLRDLDSEYSKSLLRFAAEFGHWVDFDKVDGLETLNESPMRVFPKMNGGIVLRGIADPISPSNLLRSLDRASDETLKSNGLRRTKPKPTSTSTPTSTKTWKAAMA